MKIYFGLPSHNGQIHADLIGAFIKSSLKGLAHKFNVQSYSALCYNFNKLFCNALNERTSGITHFLLLHADLVPQDFGWLDKMADIMEREKADILSVIAPIKNNTGITSTALDEPVEGNYDHTFRPRRLTLHELHKDYPKTFTHPKLLVNTGCMLVDLRKDWVEKIWFRFEDGILRNTKGQFIPTVAPEDWLFSRDAKALGAKIVATREIEVIHHGARGFPNSSGWGDWKKDRLESE